MLHAQQLPMHRQTGARSYKCLNTDSSSSHHDLGDVSAAFRSVLSLQCNPTEPVSESVTIAPTLESARPSVSSSIEPGLINVSTAATARLNSFSNATSLSSVSSVQNRRRRSGERFSSPSLSSHGLLISDQRRHSSYIPSSNFFAHAQDENSVHPHGSVSRRTLSRNSKDFGNNSITDTSTTTSVAIPNFKTEFCVKFQESGGHCPFGDRCQFVHYDHELQRRSRALTYKTRPCWTGADCPYQQNHARCIYLHGNETAEMFDQQRGISFARVKKILASKELRYQQRRYQYAMSSGHGSISGSSGSSVHEMAPPIQCASSSNLSAHWPLSLSFAIDAEHPNRQDCASTSVPTPATGVSFSSPLSSLSSSVSSSPSPVLLSTPRSRTAPHHLITSTRPAESLSITPPLLLSSSFYASEGSTTTTMSELFSPGVMPEIQVPFSSHEQLDNWSDPCFDATYEPEQDYVCFPSRHDPNLWTFANHTSEQVVTLSQQEEIKGDRERHCNEPNPLPSTGNNNANSNVARHDYSTVRRFCSMTILVSGIMGRRAAAGSHIPSGFEVLQSTRLCTDSSVEGFSTPVSPEGRYKLW